MTNENVNKLFEDFAGVSSKEWNDVIQKDLKGQDFNKKLVWKTRHGFDLMPFYREEDLADIKFQDSEKNEFPYTRGNKTGKNNWIIQHEIKVSNISEANIKALKLINAGCDSVCFTLKSNDSGAKSFPVTNEDDLSSLINGIDPEKIILRVNCGNKTPEIIAFLDKKLEKASREKMLIFFDLDPLGYLVSFGNLSSGGNIENIFDGLPDQINIFKKNFPSGKLIGIHGDFFREAGGDVVQELAFSLSMANEYFAFLTGKGLNISEIAKNIHFNFGIGPDYFIEIAKLRAARYLFSTLVNAYDSSLKDFDGMFIHSSTSEWNKSIFDRHVNILRCTTEAMSAIIGGCDSLSVRPFDSEFKRSDDFSDLVAKNIQIVLKEESGFDKVVDPGGGSYYIENITNKIIEKSWELLKMVEEKGGFIKAFADGFIQEEIKKSRESHLKNVAFRKEIVLGTNQYPNGIEKTFDSDLIENDSVLDKDSAVTIAEPLQTFRLAERFEKIRFFTAAKLKTVPKVFLLTFGNLAARKARASFSTNFFGCAGFEIIDNIGFDKIEDGIKAARDSKAEIVVLCSSDSSYPESVPDIFHELNNETILVLAGYPAEHVEEFKKLGLKHFIYLGSNVAESLENFQSIIFDKQ